RLDTDTSGAAAAGWDSLLVLTGVSRPADLPSAKDLPTYLAASLQGLFRPAVRVRPAEQADAAAVSRLLDTAGLVPDGASDRIAETLVAERRGDVVGTAAIELVDPEPEPLDDGRGRLAHLRSLAVDADQ